MSRHFIPSGDVAFQTFARKFANRIGESRETYQVSEEESAALENAVSAFELKLRAARVRGSRSQISTREKDEARAEAERIIRKIVRRIREDESITEIDRINLGLPERVEKAKHRTCPREAPLLRFINATHQAGSTPIHELRFGPADMNRKAKPAGATRLELFVALVPPEQKVGGNVIENLNARPWYLRSYTRSPIRLTPPIANVPMRVVYWARWADSVGNVGPFSAPAVGWVEGGSHLPALPNIPRNLGITQPDERINVDRSPFNDEQERIYWVAIGTAQMASLNQASEMLMLEDENEKKMLEGPDAAAA